MNCERNRLFKSDTDLLNYQCDTEEIFYHNSNHTVLFELPLTNDTLKPHKSPEKWDNDHVRMPFSSESKFVELYDDNKKSFKLRWDFIRKSLSKKFNSSQSLEEAIKSYNSRYESVWSFNTLHSYVNNHLDMAQKNKFLNSTLPEIVNLALRLPDLIKCPIPLLKQDHKNKSISMTQEQAASILANAFLCTFPRRNTTKKNSEYSNYPGINFQKLFCAHGPSSVEKIKCLINYFERVIKEMPKGVITFTRQSIDPTKFPNWKESSCKISCVRYTITSNYRIEHASQMLQVDFANKAIGGGILGNGCVQEEIRFCINPELIVARLFTEHLADNEAILVTGSEQFSTYSGYASTFRFAADFVDTTPCDMYRRKKSRIVAIDALSYGQLPEQFSEQNLTREVNKAYAGFYHDGFDAPVIATGFWGCGAFGGHPIKSALIQLMACRLAKRNLAFFTFGDMELKSTIEKHFNFLIENSVTVSQLFNALRTYGSTGNGKSPDYLIGFLERRILDVIKASSDVPEKSARPYPTPLTFSLKKPSILPNTSLNSPFLDLTDSPKTSKSPHNGKIQYTRFNDVPHSADENLKKMEEIKNRFACFQKDENSNSMKKEEKKPKKTPLLDALNDFF